MVVITLADLIPIVFCLAGLVVPQSYRGTKYKAVVVVSCLFGVSFFGAWFMFAVFKQPFGTMFARLFSLIGISHIVFSQVQSSMYWKVVLDRVGFHRKDIKEES